MFAMDPSAAWILTDTLATDELGTATHFQTKCIAVPHMDLVIAGTGLAQLNSRWTLHVLEGMLARDVEMLDRHAPEGLREVWRALWDGEGWEATPDITSTIYHVGRSERTGDYKAFAYRSTAGFESETLEPGFRIKPHPHGEFNRPESMEEAISLALQIQREQDDRPAAERVHVGGELMLTTLADGQITTTKIHRWADHEEVWFSMNERLRRLPNE